MKIRAKNTKVNPVYWAHLRKWPFGIVMDYDVTDQELAEIKADDRIAILEECGDVDVNRVLVADGVVEDESAEKRGPGRPRKVR